MYKYPVNHLLVDEMTEIIQDMPNSREAYIAQYILDTQPHSSLLDYDCWIAAERIVGFPLTHEQVCIIDGTVSSLLTEYEDDPDARLLFLGALMMHECRATQSMPQFWIFDKPALFTDSRRQINDYPPLGLSGLYAYDLRHGDDDSEPLTLEDSVTVNWFGRIYTAEPMLEPGENMRPICPDDWGFSDEEDLTPLQFIEKYATKEV